MMSSVPLDVARAHNAMYDRLFTGLGAMPPKKLLNRYFATYSKAWEEAGLGSTDLSQLSADPHDDEDAFKADKMRRLGFIFYFFCERTIKRSQ